MKKICILILLIISSLFTTTVVAQENEVTGTVDFGKLYTYSPEDATFEVAAFGLFDSFEEKIYDSLSSIEPKINVAIYGLSLDELVQRYWRVLLTHPELYYAITTFEYASTFGIVTSITPRYSTTDKDEINKTVADMNLVVEEYLALLTPEMTDIEKLLTLHNKMVAECEYDTDLQNFSAKNIFIDKKAVCQGYASAYYHLLSKIGIQADFVSSDDMNHVWNSVKLGNKWYHVDLTWDDPVYRSTSGMYGRVEYSCFLKSNEGIASEAAGPHYGFPLLDGADDTTYDNAFWNDLLSPIVVLANNWYYVSDDTVKKYNSITKETTDLYTITHYWPGPDNRYWASKFSGIGYYDGKLYFNTSDEIKSMDLYGGNIETAYTLGSDTNSIYSLFVENGVAYFGVGDYDINNTFLEPASCTLPENEEYKHFFILDTYEENGKFYIDYINNTGENDFVVYATSHTGDLLEDIESVPLSDNSTGIAALAHPTSEIFVWDKNMRPLKAVN